MSDSSEQRLLRSLYVCVVLAIVLPTIGGAAISALAGHVEFPSFLAGFLGMGGVFAAANLVLGMFAAKLIHARVVSLANDGGEASRRELAVYVIATPIGLVVWEVLFQIVGAAAHHYSIDGPGFLRTGVYSQMLPLLAARSLFAWALPPLIVCVDALGKYLAPKGLAIGAFSLRMKVISLGLLTPLMVSVLVAEFVFPTPADLTPEILMAWTVSLAIAALTTLMVWRSTARGLSPLREFIAQHSVGDDDDSWQSITPVSLDELGEFASQLRDLERRRVELRQALRESERYIAQAHRIALLGGFAVTQDGRFTWREEVVGLLGGSPAEGPATLEEFCELLVSPSDADRVRTAVERGWADRRPVSCEFELARPGGRHATIRMHAQVVSDQPGDPPRLVGIFQEITEFRLLESKLRQSQKMEALGNLTGGIAHDFNNLLAVIYGNLELLRQAGVNERQDELAGQALDAADRAAELTRNLLTFARRAPLEPRPLDLNKLVRDTKNWASRVIPESIGVETSLLAGLWRVEADPGSTESALLNLMLNARDAMPTGGSLTIETANVRIDDDYLQSHEEELPPGRFVLLAVSDTGEGISDDDLAHIFEPFFTTKSQGKGTGLGLSAVEGFVRQSGGIIQVYTEPGQGTTFKLYFPALHDASVVEQPQPAVRANASSAGARILVAEDAPDLMRVITMTLARAGYDVVAAGSGDEALRAYEQSGAIDLLLTDIVMPGTTQGPRLARLLRERDPGLPVVFMSGYANEATVHGNGLRPEDIRLMKPVKQGELLGAIETALQRRA